MTAIPETAVVPLPLPPPDAPPRVLVVDDEPAIRELLAMALTYEGWEVQVSPTGAAAMAAARGRRPDAVLLDMMLPDMDGIEVLRRLRAEFPRLPVMFLTARDSARDRAAALSAGADDYLTKPFALTQLTDRLRRLLPD